MKIKQTLISLAAATTVLSGTPAMAGGDTPSAEGAMAYFINLKDGDTVSSPFKVQFGLKGMGVSPAGVQNVPNSGHHHLLINKEAGGDMLTKPLPSDANHKHFGKGQTETMVELKPGKHTLQLLVGDWKHTAHAKPVMSKPITVIVK